MDPTERETRLVLLDAATIDKIAGQLGDAIALRVIDAIRGHHLLSEHGTTVASVETQPDATTTSDFHPSASPRRTREQAADLWTARRVAAYYGLTTSFVYQHADELGCIRLGAGKCPRLRFDPSLVRELWSTIGLPPSVSRAPRNRGTPRPRRSSHRAEGALELLEFDREP
jgi:hypothetical protein